MFPTLRLLLSASLATLVLVALVGSGMFRLLPPPARLTDVPASVRPVTPIIDDIRPGARFDGGARRLEELQRLSSLPSGPSRAYASEPPAIFPYTLDTARTEKADADLSATARLGMPDAGTAEDPAVDTEVVPEPPVAIAALPEPATPAPPSGDAETIADTPPTDPQAADVSAVETTPESPPAPIETVTAAEEDPIPLPKPKAMVADHPAVKQQATSRPRARAKKVRSVALRQVRKPLPEPTKFEERQGQFFYFGYGNTWDDRSGWTTQIVPDSGQRAQTTTAAPRRAGERGDAGGPATRPAAD
jgi:hypothetical protein